MVAARNRHRVVENAVVRRLLDAGAAVNARKKVNRCR